MHSSKIVGFLQALGLGSYIAIFATLAFQARTWVEMQAVSVHPILGIALFLLAFVISALICGSIVFAYPVLLFFDGRKSNALQIVFWTAVWLVIIFFVAAILLLVAF